MLVLFIAYNTRTVAFDRTCAQFRRVSSEPIQTQHGTSHSRIACQTSHGRDTILNVVAVGPSNAANSGPWVVSRLDKT